MRKPVKIRGGVVVQAGIGLRDKNNTVNVFRPQASHYRALVINTRVVGEQDSPSPYQVLCDVILIRTGARLMNVPVKQHRHGINNLDALWIPKPCSRVLSDPTQPLNFNRATSARGAFVGAITPFDDADGDMVLVSFMDGLIDLPIIDGAITHSKTKRIVVEGSGWDEANAGSERGVPQKDEHYTRFAGTEVRVNADGDVLVDTVGATTDEVDETPAATGGQVRLRIKDSERLTVELDGTDVLEVYKSGAQVRIDLGEGATERVVLGDSFLSFFNAHTHPSGVGPTGTPTVPMTAALLSDLAKVKKV